MVEISPLQFTPRAGTKSQTTYDEVMSGLGPLDNVRVMSNQILVGIYMRPERTAGGIYMPDKTRDEDKWQGSAAFVIKKGPLAFVDDATHEFHNQDVAVGEVVVFRTSDGLPKDINGVHCRIIEDTHIKMVVPDPAMIW